MPDLLPAGEWDIAWLLWYNRTRLRSTLTEVRPMQFEPGGLAVQPPGKPVRESAMGYAFQGQG